MCLTKFVFANQTAKMFFLDFSRKESNSRTLTWPVAFNKTKRDVFKWQRDLMDTVYFFRSANLLTLNTVCVKNRLSR